MARHRVLVVDDDVEIREVLVEILEDNGYETAAAANGREALRKLHEEAPPSLILLDLMMPVMDGRAFREEQLRTPALADIPVVVVSAYRDLEAQSAGMEVKAHLSKPLEIDELLRVTRQYCYRSANE
jgi:CheY-like chemotaxis protein